MASWLASSPASSLHGRGFAEDEHRKKCKWAAFGDPSSSKDEEVIVILKSSLQQDLVLEEFIWKLLPQEILDMILARLPFAAQCRFQCVCKRWNKIRFLSPPPSCTIMSTLGDTKARFYCESEKKWFSLPSNRLAPLGWTWEIVDAEAGLVCYQSQNDGCFWLWVCNPLKPSSSRLIVPNYPRRQRCSPQAPKVKLLVDKANGSYKIVVKLYKIPATAVYASTTSRWQVYQSSPFIPSLEFFVWKNVVHAYNTEKKWRDKRLVTAFNMEVGEWIGMDSEIPSEFHFPTNRFFLSDNNQVMLVLYSYRKRPWPYFSVWRLSDEGLSSRRPNSFAKRENWEKVMIASEKGTVDLAGYCLAHASYTAQHICFTFKDYDDTKRDDSKAHKFLRYSFAAKSWSVLPCPQGSGESTGIFIWEPNLNIDPS